MSEREFTIATAQAEIAAIEAGRTKLIQEQAAEIEELQRSLALAEIRIEELMSKLNESREDPHG